MLPRQLREGSAGCALVCVERVLMSPGVKEVGKSCKQVQRHRLATTQRLLFASLPNHSNSDYKGRIKRRQIEQSTRVVTGAGERLDKQLRNDNGQTVKSEREVLSTNYWTF